MNKNDLKSAKLIGLGISMSLVLGFYYCYPAVMVVVAVGLATLAVMEANGGIKESARLAWINPTWIWMAGSVTWAACLATLLLQIAPPLLFVGLSILGLVGLYWAWDIYTKPTTEPIQEEES
jgi:hypothetical protein